MFLEPATSPCSNGRRNYLRGEQLRWIAITILGLIATSATAQSLPGDRLIVPGSRIGAADLAPADQGALTRVLGEPRATERKDDMDYYRYGAGDGPDELVVAFDLKQDQPFEISTFSPSYRTREGLGVGSSEERVRAGLGRPICQGRDNADDEVIAYDSIWFLLTRGAVTRVSIRAHLAPGAFAAIACKAS